MKVLVLLWTALVALVLIGLGCGWRLAGWPGVGVMSLLMGAAMAGALTPLGLLNFCVLQWFGVRLCMRYMDMAGLGLDVYRVGDRVGAATTSGRLGQWRIIAKQDDVHVRLMRYGVQRWIWPLTGWWTDYRWIARRK